MGKKLKEDFPNLWESWVRKLLETLNEVPLEEIDEILEEAKKRRINS